MNSQRRIDKHLTTNINGDEAHACLSANAVCVCPALKIAGYSWKANKMQIHQACMQIWSRRPKGLSLTAFRNCFVTVVSTVIVPVALPLLAYALLVLALELSRSTLPVQTTCYIINHKRL